MNTTTKLGLGLVAAAAVAIVGATPASADATNELDFLTNLTYLGLQVYNTPQAIGTGYAICGALNTTPETDVVVNVFTHTSWTDVPDIRTAAIWVASAEQALCPGHRNI